MWASTLGLLFLVEGVGFEPTKPDRAPDLQSGGFNHSPTPPLDSSLAVLLLRRKDGWGGSRRFRAAEESPRGDSNPPTCRLQVGCAAIAPLGRFRPYPSITERPQRPGPLLKVQLPCPASQYPAPTCLDMRHEIGGGSARAQESLPTLEAGIGTDLLGGTGASGEGGRVG